MGAELQRELYAVLREEVRDPRLAEITVQEVRVARDLAHAKVFFTCFPDDADADLQARLLNGRLAGFVRHALAQRVRLRTMPQLHFVHDESVRSGERLSALIESAVAGSGDPPAAPGDSAGAGRRASGGEDAPGAPVRPDARGDSGT